MRIRQIRSYNRRCPDPNDVVFKCILCNKEFSLAKMETVYDEIEFENGDVKCPYCGIVDNGVYYFYPTPNQRRGDEIKRY